jgi:GMC oxidoreductase/Sodium/hydrogen exchanger family
MAPPPDPLAQAVSMLRTIRGGGADFDAKRLAAALDAVGCTAVRVVPRQGPAPMEYVIGRRAGYPCLVNGKADAHIVCVEPALRYPNVTLRTRTRVTRLETDGPGRAVTRVVTDRDGQAETYSADLIVVSAGAINSAALLLASASERHPGGLGNSSGVVGRHLMMHNNSSLIAFSKIPNPTKFQKTLGVNDFYFGDPDDDGTFPYPLGALQMLGKNDATLIAFDAPDAEDPVDLARHSMDFWLTTEDLPLPGNQVLLGRDGRIRLRYTQTNAEAHRRLRGKFEGLLDAIQCRDTVLPGYHYLGGRLGINAVAHQNGTVRFGADPATSALDLNCKMHDGYGFLVPVFFVSSGIRLNLTGLLHSPSALARVPVFLLALLAVRGLPALLGLRAAGTRPTLALGLLQATSLPFIVTATQIGVALGKLSSVTAAALVCAGLLSVLIFPLIALGLLRRNEPGPAAVPDMTAPVAEPHLM